MITNLRRAVQKLLDVWTTVKMHCHHSCSSREPTHSHRPCLLPITAVFCHFSRTHTEETHSLVFPLSPLTEPRLKTKKHHLAGSFYFMELPNCRQVKGHAHEKILITFKSSSVHQHLATCKRPTWVSVRSYLAFSPTKNWRSRIIPIIVSESQSITVTSPGIFNQDCKEKGVTTTEQPHLLAFAESKRSCLQFCLPPSPELAVAFCYWMRSKPRHCLIPDTGYGFTSVASTSAPTPSCPWGNFCAIFTTSTSNLPPAWKHTQKHEWQACNLRRDTAQKLAPCTLFLCK